LSLLFSLGFRKPFSTMERRRLVHFTI
jgi:hypothetical protein